MINLVLEIDLGKNFKELMPAYGVSNGVHPDHHAWWIHPDDGSFMIDGNDGGMNITKDKGATWRFIGNLPVAQFYHIECKIMAHGEVLHMFGKLKELETHIGKKLVLEMALMWFLIKMIHVTVGL